jgi:hypothetical protein
MGMPEKWPHLRLRFSRFAVADGGRTLPGDDADLYDPDTTPPTCARRMSAMAATSRTAKKVLTI